MTMISKTGTGLLKYLLATAVLISLPVRAEAQPPRTARQDTVTKRETLPPLTLPDIVIFGRGSAAVREGSKLFAADKRTALEREIGAPVGEKMDTDTGLGGARTLAARERVELGRQARIYLRGGTYGEITGGGEYWVDVDRIRLLVSTGIEGSQGHVTNSASLGGRGELSLIHSLTPKTEVRLRGGFGSGRQEEWGMGVPADGIPAVPVDAVRRWFDADYSFELEGMLHRGLTFRAGAGGRNTGLQDDVRGTGLKPRSSGRWAGVEMEWVTGRMLLSMTGRTEGDRISGVAPIQHASLSSGKLSLQALVGESSSAMLGAVWYHLDSGLNPVTRLWPQALFTSRYSERFSMYVRYRPRIDYITLGDARGQNPFVANSYEVVPREERFNLAIGLNYKLAPRVMMGFEVARRLFDRLPVWRLAPASDPWSDGLFVLDGIVSVGVNETRLSLESTQATGFGLNGDLVLRAPTGGGISELAHIPRLEFSMEVKGRGPFDLALSSRLTYLGERFGDSVDQVSRRLDSATDLSLRAAREIGKYLTAWLELRNILDQEYALWEGYPLPGRTFAFGLSVRF